MTEALVCEGCRERWQLCGCERRSRGLEPHGAGVCGCGRQLVLASKHPQHFPPPPPADVSGALHRCGDDGCGYESDDAGEMAVHSVTAHDFEEVPAPSLVALPTASVCGHCGIGGPDAFLGDLGWARVTVSRPDGQTVALVVLVPVHLTPLCANEAGVREALAQLVNVLNGGAARVSVELPTTAPGRGAGND